MIIQRAFRSVVLCFVLMGSTFLCAQGREYIQSHYTKHEYYVPMRDGVKLFTAVYAPKDAARTYPIMLDRTPYTVSPYGVDHYPPHLGPSELFAKEGFIFAYQDVRGRYMSEGVFEDLRPHKPEKRAKDIDESTDTYDTIDWLVKNIPNNNGRVGMAGISYDGFFVAAGMIDAHPALKAASPQAPVADCYMGDDCYHNGALWLPHGFSFFTFFYERRGGPQRPGEFHQFDYGTPDGYDYYLRMGAVANSEKLLNPQNVYWNQIVEHPTYDEFWQSRAITRFFRNLPPSVLTVGGWFDAEDLSGALRVFRAADKVNGAGTHLVMGPWRHGGWAGGDGDRLGNVYFASKTAAFYRENIEFPFFMQQLKDAKDTKQKAFPKAWVFETGSNEWRTYDSWPPKNASPTTFYLGDNGRLSTAEAPAASGAFDEYVSDPNKPVPLLGYIAQGMTSDYMTEDQRFASERPDVLVYETEPLSHDVSVAGPVSVRLFVSTSGTDSDFDVKLVDVYPGDFPNPPSGGEQEGAQRRPQQTAVKMGGYQQLVRGEPFRGRYRNSFEKPEPFEPGKVAKIEYTMPDICHTFRKGHRIMVQVQSSWFPLSDRNPQKFVPDIANASPADFQKATERVYRSSEAPSGITLFVQK